MTFTSTLRQVEIRFDVIVSQALAALVTCFSVELHRAVWCLAGAAHDPQHAHKHQPPHFPSCGAQLLTQWSEIGFVLHQESLLSTGTGGGASSATASADWWH